MAQLLQQSYLFLNKFFKRLKKIKFIGAEAATARLPMAIGKPVNPSIAVSAMELNGDVEITVMSPPSIIPIIIGLSVVATEIMEPIFPSVAFTMGSISIAIPRDNGAATNKIARNSTPAGSFFSKNLTIKATTYPAKILVRFQIHYMQYRLKQHIQEIHRLRVPLK